MMKFVILIKGIDYGTFYGGKNMRCPNCDAKNTRVLDSRPIDEGRSIRRRRECESCQYRFTTFERVEEIPLIVVKKEGTEKNLIVRN